MTVHDKFRVGYALYENGYMRLGIRRYPCWSDTKLMDSAFSIEWALEHQRLHTTGPHENILKIAHKISQR